MTRVAAYCRVSTDKLDQMSSLTSQRKFFTEYIGQKPDWSLMQIYFDEGITGTSTKKRRGFNQMIDDAQGGYIDLIITKEISRFARNTLDSLKYTRLLKSIGVGVIFLSDNINTLDPDSELRLTIMSSIAQEESRRTSSRVKWGQTQRMKAGVVFGRDMLGYFVEGGRLRVNPAEAETVRLIFHEFLHNAKSTHAIAKQLNAIGIKPKRSEKFSNVAVLRILQNEKYVGDLLQKKTFTPDYLTHEKKANHGAEEKIYLRDNHEPIIAREVWDRAQQELAARVGKKRHSRKYWCSGKIVCGDCGRRFVARVRGTQTTWRCGGAVQNSGCKARSVSDRAIIACVRHVVLSVELNMEKVINAVLGDIKLIVSQGGADIDVAHLAREIATLKDKKAMLINSMLEGVINKEDVRLMNARYDAEISKVYAEIAKAKATNPSQLLLACEAELRATVQSLNKINEIICGEIVDKIILQKDNRLCIFMAGVAQTVRWHSTGRLSSYRVTVETIG